MLQFIRDAFAEIVCSYLPLVYIRYGNVFFRASFVAKSTLDHRWYRKWEVAAPPLYSLPIAFLLLPILPAYQHDKSDNVAEPFIAAIFVPAFFSSFLLFCVSSFLLLALTASCTN